MTVDTTVMPASLTERSAKVTYTDADAPGGFTISQVAALTGLSAHTLRWYERIGLMPHIDRSHQGRRRYMAADLNWLTFVARLRLTGMPVADMVHYAEMVRAGEHTAQQRRDMLVAHRRKVLAQIDELRGTVEVLDFKIDCYGERMLCASPEGKQT
jgi:DNA-binding transcriptional MerR regulator